MDTERLLMPEMLEGKECRGGRVELVLETGLGRDGSAVAMLLAASVSMCAIRSVEVVVWDMLARASWFNP